MRRTSVLVTAVVLAASHFNPAARASFHLWQITQVYSNASGSVQFIQFQQAPFTLDDESFLSLASIVESANGNSYPFPANLPSAPAPNSFFLVATPGYAALSGVPAADYTLPSNNWFSRTGDTLIFAGGVNTLTFTSGQLPSDGTQSLFRAYGTSTFSTGTNTITNFLGQTGSIPAPEPASLTILASALSLCLLRRRH